MALELQTVEAMVRPASLSQVRKSLLSASTGTGRRVILIYSALICANIGAWVWAVIAFHRHPILLGAAFLAYSFGLRHAVDADHIAAIDNVTRKLMNEGKRPVAVGLFFSLGHSSIVFGLSISIAVASLFIKKYFHEFESMGSIIGTFISALFLLAIAIANIHVLISVYRGFQRVKSTGQFVEEDMDVILAKRGFFGRIFNKLFRLIQHSWQMYLLGFLFGLGFDTATEVGLLGISASEATKGFSLWSILVFPALFTAGMALVDFTDGVLMLGAYGWAFVNPVRKLYYNMTVVSVSILVALFIGGIEALGLLGLQLKTHGPIWSLIGSINDNAGLIGLSIIGVFVACWAISVVVYRINCYDKIEVPATLVE